MSSRSHMGLLQPLLIPSRLGSDISVDFVIALTKLPSAKETAEIMMNHVVKIHGIPRAIVSDWRPQFVTAFWRDICWLIGAKATLNA